MYLHIKSLCKIYALRLQIVTTEKIARDCIRNSNINEKCHKTFFDESTVNIQTSNGTYFFETSVNATNDSVFLNCHTVKTATKNNCKQRGLEIATCLQSSSDVIIIHMLQTGILLNISPISENKGKSAFQGRPWITFALNYLIFCTFHYTYCVHKGAIVLHNLCLNQGLCLNEGFTALILKLPGLT